MPPDLDATMFRAETDAGVETETAVTLLTFAAGEGQAAAQLVLGLRYLDGDGVAKDEIRAVHWFSIAAEQDNARAQYWLARCYLAGQGVRHSYRRAYFWCQTAIANGHADPGCIRDGAGQHLTPDERRWTDAEVRTVRFRRR